MATGNPGATPAREYVWDIPTRLFHWLLVVLLGFSWWSAETYRMDWHRYSGLTILGLVLFRFLWGFFGTSTSRFGQFIKGPRAIWTYLRPNAGAARAAPLGHNPLGGWAVLAMLLALVVQVGSGLFAVDIDGIESGPLSHLVDFDQGRVAADVHELSFTALQVLVVLHVLAIIVYLLLKRRNLVGAMVTGYRRPEGESASAGAERVPLWRLLPVLAAVALLVYIIANGLRF